MQKKITRSLRTIANALEEYEGKIAVACSFGKDSMVLVDLCQRIDPDIQVFSVMTPYKPDETLKYKMFMEEGWNIKTYCAPETGVNLYEQNVEQCCDYYKVSQFKEAIKELKLDAWISGLRNTEGHTREFLDTEEYRAELMKINPILDWTESDVWLYHAMREIPVHPLYAQGYRSLGCAPCSAPYTDAERGGRWQGTDKCGGECGIHTQSLKT